MPMTLYSPSFTSKPSQAVNAKLAADLVLDPQLLVQPGDHRLAEDGNGVRPGRERGGQQALELRQRFLVEHDVVYVVGGDAGLFEAIGDGVGRIARVVLLA